MLEPRSIYDAAIIGVVSTRDGQRIAYSSAAIIEILMRDNMTAEEAQEFFEFNIEDAHMGPLTPVYLSMRPEGMDVTEWLESMEML